MKPTFFLMFCLSISMILQAQVSKNLEVTAGGLKTALTAEELTTITKLTLTGTIDARDIKTMRDDMPVLAEIDLNGVSIAAYSGTEGTSSWGTTNYAANVFPEFAFMLANWQGKYLLTSIVLPPDIIEIGPNAFGNCHGLTTINIPNSVITIRGSAFLNCSNLASVFISASVASIDFGAFNYSPCLFYVDANNQTYSSAEGVLFDKNQTTLITFPLSKAGSYTIPSTVTTIKEYAFNGCSMLTSLVVPNSIRKIENYAICNCWYMTSVEIRSSATTIGEGFLYSCNSLASLTVSWPVPPELSLFYYPLYFVDKTTCTLQVPFGSKVTYQAAGQWQDFQHISEIQGVFLSDFDLDFFINGGTAQINYAVSDVWTATPDQDWVIAEPAAGEAGAGILIISAVKNQGGERTTTVTFSSPELESQIIEIKQQGFIEVTAGNLKTVLAGQLPTLTNLGLTGTMDARDFKTMRDDMPMLAAADLSGVTIVEYTGDEGTSIIGNTFYPANTIPEYAFVNTGYDGKKTLTSFELPTTTTEIGEYAFGDCQGLVAVSLPGAVKTIRDYAFYNCIGMSSVLISASVTSIAQSAFLNCTGFYQVDSNNPVFSSNEGVLYDKNQTKLIHCPVSKTGNLTIPSSVITIGNQAFFNCQQLTGVIIPETVKYIEMMAFYNCRSLTSVVIPPSVKITGDGIFAECKNLQSITVLWLAPSSVYVTSGSFFNVNKTTCVLYVPYGSKAAYQAANPWKSFVNIVELPGIYLSEYNLRVGAFAENTGVKISSSEAWSATSDASWLTLTPVSGEAGASFLNISVTENPGAKRTATILFSAPGVEPKILKVIQFEKVEVTAGNLKTILADRLSEITEITISGTIDARDFKTMRDDMPLLEVIDLSRATIAEYNGDEGTSVFGITNYAANSIPECAFMNENTEGKNSLTTFVMPVNTTEIGNYAFAYCNRLYSIAIPASVQNIQNYVFWRCYGLTSASVESSEAAIGFGFLGNCTSLSSLVVSWPEPLDLDLVYDEFANVRKNTCTLYVPIGSTTAYKNANVWKDFLNMAETPTINVSATLINIDYSGGSAEPVNITSNLQWKAVSGPSWLTVDPGNGTNSGVLNLTATVNTGFSTRIATVMVTSSTGDLGKIITVVQNGNISICPQHFRTVWEGEPGFEIMNINITGAQIDGFDLEPGDEIGVFDGDICVGYGKLNNTISPQQILTVFVSHDDGSGNGYTEGNEISYKFWDCSTQTEVIVNDIQCFNKNSEPVSCLPFEVSASAYVKLSVISDICQTLTFATGWNIVSVPLYPDSTNMLKVFGPLMTSKSLVKIMDEEGSSVEDWGIYGGWKNNIGNISPTEGYKVKLSKDDNFEICGTPVKYPFAIPLKSGWNIMGYPQTEAYDALEVLKQLINEGKLVKVQDEGGFSIEDWGIYGGWKNNIGDFVPGKGYNIKLNTDVSLWINESYPKSTSIQPEFIVTTHFKPAFTGNGLDHTNINLVGLPLNILQAGDEIAVFDGTTCVGAVTLTSRNISNQSVSIAASAKDNQGMAGFTEGNPIMLKLWNSKQNTEYTLEPEILKGSAVFTKHESTFASLEKYVATGLVGISEFELTEINCYPNPFCDEINIEIRLAKDSEVQVEVLNQIGQRVRFVQTEKMLNSGVHRLSWNGKNAGDVQVSTGIYHLKITIDNSVIVRKMIYSK